MSTFEIQPQFTDGSSPKLSVNQDILQARIELLLNDVFAGRGVIVDVTIRDTMSFRPEWRVIVPPREYDIYRAISNVLSFADAVYSEHVKRGNLDPREYIVSVWCRSKNEPAIIGSTD